MMKKEEALDDILFRALECALKEGANDARISLSTSLLNLVGVLNGKIDKIKTAMDRSLQLCLFVDGRYGTFSTNCTDKGPLEEFIRRSVAMVRILEKDPCRKLPAASRVASDAVSGMEAGIWDPSWAHSSMDKLRDLTLQSSLWDRKSSFEKGFRLLAEEGELSVNTSINSMVDSRGMHVCHMESSYDSGFEVTLETPDGELYEDYWWDSSPRLENFLESAPMVSAEAVKRAAVQIGRKPCPGGLYNMVVDRECSSRLLTPILNAISGSSIQQKNSFLLDSIGKKLFPGELSIIDEPRTYGATGAKFFDNEGVATYTLPIIEKGILKNYYINTYISEKTGLAPTVESWTRPVLKPFGGCKTMEDLMKKTGDGILVCGFNGGNFNSSTGDFSYGIEGFAFRDGVITHPVGEMLITGNLLTLWASLRATADDARLCNSKLIPTLAFSNVAFSA